MPPYVFRMIDAAGSLRRGEIDLPVWDEAAAVRYLERGGATVLGLRRAGPGWRLRRLLRPGGRVSRRDLAVFFNDLAVLLGSGVPVRKALEDIRRGLRPGDGLDMTVDLLLADIEAGRTFSQAMERHPGVFPRIVRDLARVGDETGKLAALLAKGAAHLRNMDDISRQAWRAMLYPGLILAVVCVMGGFWVGFVAPRITDVFRQAGLEMPIYGRVMMAGVNFLREHGLSSAMTLALLGVSGAAARMASARVRLVMDAAVLRLPVIGQAVETAATAGVAESAAALLGAGVGMRRTLTLIGESVGNAALQVRFSRAVTEVERGASLAAALAASGAVQPLAARMLEVGESSGRFDEQAAYAAGVYRDRLSGLVAVVRKVAEPILLILVGFFFILLVVGLMLPVYDLVGRV